MEDLETILEAYENCESKNIDCNKCPYQNAYRNDDVCYSIMYKDMYEHLKALKEENEWLEDENESLKDENEMLYEENDRLFDECNERLFDDDLE